MYYYDLVHKVNIRLGLHFKTLHAQRTMPGGLLIDLTHWDVSAVVLVLMLFTKWYPINVLLAEKLNYFTDITTMVKMSVAG